MTWKSNISFKKDTEKVVLLKGLMKIIVRFKTEKFFYTFVSCNKYSFEGARNTMHRNNCDFEYNAQKWFLQKSYIARYTFLRGVRAAPIYQQGAQKNCVLEFLILSALKITSCELVVFIDMSTYILTESRNCKTLLKENYAAAFDSPYVFIERGIKHGADSAHGVCIH